jgi:hypothetical protein
VAASPLIAPSTLRRRRRGTAPRAAPTPEDAAATSTSSSSSKKEPAYAYSDPVNRLLGNFLPPARDATAELAHVNWRAPKATGLSLDALADRVRAELAAREWFVTGDLPPELFSDAFTFKDDSVATAGVRSYALGVRKLFDQATSRVELVSVAPDAAARALRVVWRLQGRVNLPLRPTIAPYVVTTTLGVDANTGLIATQLDEFSEPGWRLLAGALLGAWAGPPPAPSVEVLRAQARARGEEGVVGGG